MPSGAKKRKAAKKKQENKSSSPISPTSSTTTTHSIGNEDLKQHGSDGDHNSEQYLTEGEEDEVVLDKREEGSSCPEGSETTGDVEKKSDGVEGRVVEEEGVVHIEREPKSDDEFENKKGGSSSSSRSRLDDEFHAVEKDVVVTDNAPVVDIVEAVDSLSERDCQVSSITAVSQVDNSVLEAAADLGMEKASFSDLKAPADISVSPDNSLTPVLNESELKENGERKSSSHEESTTLVGVVKDLVPQHKNDEAASDAKESAAGESQDNTPVHNAIKDDEHVKDSEVPGPSDAQPITASAPQPVQTTSWKGCCGLFELFTGSNR